MMKNILKSLIKCNAYPEPTTKVDLIQTHASWIFLTDTHAYKVKKPVDFGFLNFSTIDRRRFYCNEEIKLNRRLCPEIYEGVVEVVQTNDGAAFYGKGTVIDYAVKMKKLPSENMMDKLIINGDISSSDIHRITKIIADFHVAIPTSPSIKVFGETDKIHFNWKENIDQMIGFENKTLPALDREYIRNWVYNFIENNSVLFNKRIENGFIKECDGDIHLENICLVEDKIHIFDCIEFNERFRNCDTASDIAFLIMDLDFHNRHDLADEALSSYQQLADDRSLSEVINFYMVYRAFVRGKVESFRLREKDLDHNEQSIITEKAVKYFRLARGYIERQTLPPTLFITCGLMGSGKSTLAEQLSFELGISCFSSDKTRKTIAAIEHTTNVSSSFKEGLYTDEISNETYNELLKLAENNIKLKHSIIVDACFTKMEYRDLFSKLAQKYLINFVILYVCCTDTDIRRRLNDRALKNKSVSDGRLELLKFQEDEFSLPSEGEGIIININTSTPPVTLTNLIYDQLHSK